MWLIIKAALLPVHRNSLLRCIPPADFNAALMIDRIMIQLFETSKQDVPL
jgi:hypothetical protein